MKKVIIIGAGGYAAELYDYIAYFNSVNSSDKQIQVVGLIDNNQQNYLKYEYECPFLGSITSHTVQKDLYYLIGIANVKYREKFVVNLLEQGANFTNFIHPMAYVSKSAKIGEGVVIYQNATIGPLASVGDFSLINSRCSIGHDTVVGKFNFLSPNVCLSGNTRIGNSNLFGINSATIPEISVGSGNQIMAGITLVNSIGDDQVVYYRNKDKILSPKLKE
jgi:sugar O-acyltransferase (sialic acid O-acetyltransferase NeuD family)